MRSNPELSGMAAYKDEEQKSVFTGAKVYRGMINGDHMSAMASSMQPEQMAQLINDDAVGALQRGLVFLVLFTALMQQIEDYERQLVLQQYIPEDYLIIMQVLMGSILTQIDIANRPSSVLTQQYSSQMFRFKTISIRFEAKFD